MRLILAVIVTVASACMVQAQTSQHSTLRFDVVSIKPSTLGPFDTVIPPRTASNRYVRINITLRDLIQTGLGLNRSIASMNFYFRRGLGPVPDRVLDSRFDIEALLPDGTSRDSIPEMIRSLLVDRFHLTWHTDRRQIDAYALATAKAGATGPMLRPTTWDCQAFRKAGGTIWSAERPRNAAGEDVCFRQIEWDKEHNAVTRRGAGTIAALIDAIQPIPDLDRPLGDATGLTGRFEWHLTCADNPHQDSDAPSIFEALREQLGLVVTPTKAMMDITVVDSVDLPTPN